MSRPARILNGRTWTATANGNGSQNRLQESMQGNWLSKWIHARFVFPRGELAIVTETGQRISLPTPLLASLVALFIWIGGGTIAFTYFMGRMSGTVDNLSSTFTQFQIHEEAEKKAQQDRTDAEIKALREKLDLSDLKIADLREKQIRAEARRNN